MRTQINENIVMQYYLEELERDNIKFLKGKTEKKEEISKLINEMIKATRMNEKIQIAVKLWKALFSASMSYIDANKRGYDKIFKYFDEYVEFEELIFASDSFYRDHTLHCLWVYFLSVYVRKNEAFKQFNHDYEPQMSSIDSMKNFIEKLNLVEYFHDLYDVLSTYEYLRQSDDALMCITSLTHDLGYPIKKMAKINKSMTKILPYYAINSYENFSFEYDEVQQHFIENFINFLSSEMQANLSESDEIQEFLKNEIYLLDDKNLIGIQDNAIEKMSPEKCEIFKKSVKLTNKLVKNPSLIIRYSNDFEQYHHGIMSAFLLMKNLGAFQNMNYNYQDLSSLDGKDLSKLFIKQLILSSIADHTSEAYRFTTFSSTSCLTFIDELEEFSRISRASQNREFVEEFCESYLYMEDGWLNIDFEFTNDKLDNLDPEISFRSRCKRFLSIFKVESLSQNMKIKLRCIGKLEKNKNIYTLEIARKHADILINGESQNIPKYLKSEEFFTKEEYAKL